jgi:hypothetical protein
MCFGFLQMSDNFSAVGCLRLLWILRIIDGCFRLSFWKLGPDTVTLKGVQLGTSTGAGVLLLVRFLDDQVGYHLWKTSATLYA